MAGGADRDLRSAVLPGPGRGAGDARVAAAGVALRGGHVPERPWPHLVLDAGAHGGCGDLSTARARVLFISISVRSFAVADGAAAAHRRGGFSIAHGRLTTTSENWWAGTPDGTAPALLLSLAESCERHGRHSHGRRSSHGR